MLLYASLAVIAVTFVIFFIIQQKNLKSSETFSKSIGNLDNMFLLICFYLNSFVVIFE